MRRDVLLRLLLFVQIALATMQMAFPQIALQQKSVTNAYEAADSICKCSMKR